MTTNTRGIMILMALTMALGVRAWAGVEKTNDAPEQLRLELDLVDGSHIIGAPVLKSVPVRTSYAAMDVPLAKLATIKIGTDHETAAIDLQNGDKLQGVITPGPIKLETVFGKVSIGMEYIAVLRVVLPGAEKPKSAAEQHEDCVACINNLRLIDHAKQQLATASQTMTDAYVPTMREIKVYFKGNGVPVCRAGGTYTINSIAQNPTCSKADLGHVLVNDIQ